MKTDSLNRPITEDSELFRDRIRSISDDGGRNWVYAKLPVGFWNNARTVVAWVLLAFFFSAPFIRVNGHPFLQFDLINRVFFVGGMVFWPADFHLLVLGGLTALVTLVIFTAIYGRIWCGWACPQTIFLEFLFRRIETWIEGDRGARIRLDKAEWGPEKVLRKGAKHAVFFGLSFLISNLFLAYIIGTEALWEIVTDPPSEHLAGLSAITVFSGVFYAVFARFREQVCHFACPYGRHQSVMVDEDSLSVTYDFRRGEPRANPKVRRTQPEAAAYGSCIDCEECVRVCPMGIDIRNGIQLECIQCTACIDACDDIMDRIKEPRGLIRYASHNHILTGTASIFTPRVKAYLGVWLVVFGLFIYFFSTRADTQAIILRTPGVMHATLADGRFTNLYNLTLLNKTFDSLKVDVVVTAPAGAELRRIGSDGWLAPQQVQESRFLLVVPPEAITGNATDVRFEIRVDGETTQEIRSSFIGPAQ